MKKKNPLTIEVESLAYGNVVTTSNMKAALNLPPKFMIYDQLKMEDLETEVEKGITKARYSLMSKPDDNNNNVENNLNES
jgi:hypothetical protein